MKLHPKESFSIREAGVSDCPAAARVNVLSWRESLRGVVPRAHLDQMSVGRRARAFAEGFGERGAGFYGMLVAERPGEGVVGYVDFGDPRGPWPFDAELYSIYVLKENQGRGAGGALLRECVRRVVARGRRSMFLLVLAVNPYRKFYEKHGGRVAGRETVTLAGAEFEELVYGWDELT